MDTVILSIRPTRSGAQPDVAGVTIPLMAQTVNALGFDATLDGFNLKQGLEPVYFTIVAALRDDSG